MLEKLDKMQGIQRTRMTVEQRKEALFKWPRGVVHQEFSSHKCPTGCMP